MLTKSPPRRPPAGPPPPARRRPGSGPPPWSRLSRDRLLELRLCDLGLRVEGTPLARRVERLRGEMERAGLAFRPHVWLSDEWFSPDGVPGIAMPFYLAHPRLMRLERSEIGEVEGGDRTWCMKILRHEAGHAIDTAYRLHRRRRFRELFGSYREPYPDVYQVRPYSRRYVLHLDLWYAQSHPAEDFAETFAVWLGTRSRWKTDYVGWPALRKLEYVDDLMAEIGDRRPPVRSRRRSGSIARMRKTLRAHYAEKRARYGVDDAGFFDRELRRLFPEDHGDDPGEAAASFLRREQSGLRARVARWTGQYRYTVDQVLDEVIERCAELGLRRADPSDEARTDALMALCVLTMRYVQTGRHRMVL